MFTHSAVYDLFIFNEFSHQTSTSTFTLIELVAKLSTTHAHNLLICHKTLPLNFQVDFGFAKFIKPGSKTWTFAGTPEV